MIPILYEKTETAFISNGIGRLSDCISCIVTEERNGLYECDFEYPISGINFDLIQVGRIIGVTHDESNDVEPFDIVSYSRPINGVVTFHCNHISYRLSYCTVIGSSISSLADTFTLFESAEPSMPFTFKTDKTSSGYLACADGTPRSVRQIMGGIEGSILDTYGGEYSYNNWDVSLNASRGVIRDFTIRYGVNMLDYNEDFNSQGTYSSCIPYWTDGENTVVGDRQNSSSSTITGRNECVPLDVSDKFEDQPTKAEVEAMGLSMLTSKNTSLPTQNIHVEFARLQGLGEYAQVHDLLRCGLCDTIKVIFPDYNVIGQFKIVKTVWNVLKDRYDSMELGNLSTSLSEALGISNGLNNSNGGGGGSGTPIPTPDATAAFDSSAHMNSSDMTAQEVSDFVDGLDAHGSHSVTVLATGATLYRIGDLRMLTLEDWTPSTLTIPTGDRPSAKAIGTGHRANGGVYITICRIEVATTGVVSAYNAGSYNTGNGWSASISSDRLTAMAMWSV